MDKPGRLCSGILWAVLLFMAVLSVMAVRNPGRTEVLSFSAPENFSAGWVVENGGEPMPVASIVVKPGDVISISKQIPPELSGQVFCFRNRHFDVRFSIDGKVISRVGTDAPLTFLGGMASSWECFTFAPSYAGKKLNVRVENRGKAQTLDMHTFMVGSRSDIAFVVLRSDMRNNMENISLLFIALFLLVYCFILNRYRFLGYVRAVLFLGLLSLDSFLWNMLNAAEMQFLSVSQPFLYQASYWTFYALPIFLLLFYREMFYHVKSGRQQRKILTDALSVYGAAVLVLLCLHSLDIVHFSVSLPVVHVLMILSLLLVTILSGRSYYQEKSSAIKWPFISLLTLYVGTIFNLLSYYGQNRMDFSLMFRRSMILYLGILCATTVRESMRQFRDVLMVEHYKKLAYIDPVTGGNTRQYFAEHFREMPADADHWFVCANVIGFKLMNQAYGYEVCDQMLKALYTYANRYIGAEEMLCNLGNARFGGLIKAADKDSIRQRLGRLQGEVRRYAEDEHLSIPLQLRFYVYRIPAGERNFDLIEDRALLAQNNPDAEQWPEEGAACFKKECLDRMLYEKELENGFEDAIRKQEFLVYLQPKFNPRTGELRAAEALIRWNHPKYGLLQPGSFVDLLERTGMISPADLYVFEKTCIFIDMWKLKGLQPPVISVNISRMALVQENFFDRYLDIIRKTGVDTSLLQFEFTESVAFDNMALIKKIIGQIHEIGAACALDDFGKSYSNMNALEELEFDTVKMDKCFFDNGFPEDATREHFVAGVIRFLKELGTEVVAEGIERKEQADHLAALDCDLIQGYYYAKPMPEEKFRELLEGEKK